jgi:V8-like Glu-specific endopeptidase
MMHDVGLITLKGNPGQRVGWLGVAWNDSLPPFVGNIVGYPADKQPPKLMWRSTCNINPFDGYPNLFQTQCDTYGGSSGSSIYDDELNVTSATSKKSSFP